MVERTEDTLWSNIASRVLITTVTHPIEYAKVLIQIGYEPVPPKPTTTFFGKPALALPNIFQYVRYIKSVDGFTGCYRGLVPKLCAYAVGAVVFEKTSESIVFEDEPEKQVEEEDLSEVDRKKRYFYDLMRDVISRVAGIIVSHPLDVIALRAMAQFVGSETKYSGLFGSIVEVYRENGISGYYSGIVPRLIGNIVTMVMVSASTYVINKYIIREFELKGHTSSAMTFLCTTITYPFHVVAHCMMVNNSGLEAGRPPRMPIYYNWMECWTHLSSMDQLKRGSSMIWRYYTGPYPGTQSVQWQSVVKNKSNKFKRLE